MSSSVAPPRARAYQGESDLLAMRRMLMEARARTNDWRYAHVGELQWDFFMILCRLDPREHIRLWHDERGALIGYATLGEDAAINWQAAPEHEGAGIEEEALAWAESLLAGLRRRDAGAWGGPLVAGARQDDAARIAFLERHGFRYQGRFAELHMIRSLDEPIPDAPLPDGFEVRAYAGESELTQRANAQREVWQPWSVGQISDNDYRRFTRLPGYERDLDIVTVAPDGVVAAYVNGWADPLNRIGDFGPVGALPAYRRRGLTRAALVESLRRMRAHGMERVCISTAATNAPARSLYESIGFRAANRYLDYMKTDEKSEQRATTV